MFLILTQNLTLTLTLLGVGSAFHAGCLEGTVGGIKHQQAFYASLLSRL